MKKSYIKKLAQVVSKEKTLTGKTVDFILKLNRDDLKTFISFYKLGLKKNTVIITSAENLTIQSLKEIEKIYKNKRIIRNIDSSLGAGIKIEDEDNIIDFTFKKYINDTINLLK